MSPGDLVFGKPVLLQSYTGKTLVNGINMKAVMSTSAPEEADCVLLVRNDDGTVSIQSMRNKLYLSVKGEEEEDDSEEEEVSEEEEEEQVPSCFFNAEKIEETEMFVLKLLDEYTFSLKSEDLGFEMERVHDEAVCKRHLMTKAPSMLWMMTDFPPPSGAPSKTPSLVHTTAIVCDNAASRAEDALSKRHATIVDLAMAGKSIEFIDDILERLYGVTAVSTDGKALE